MNESQEKLSGVCELVVLLSTRNGRSTLGAVLDGYVAQEWTGFSWEIIIVDNGSTDDTEALVHQYSGILPITLLYEPQPSKNRAMNRGLAGIRSTFLVLTDDDAIPEPDFLQAWWETAQNLPDYDLFGGRIEPKYPFAPPKWIGGTDYLCDMMFARRDLPEGPVAAGFIFGPNMAIRRRVLDDGLTFDESIGPNGTDPNYPMGSETEFLLRASRAGYRSYFVRRPRVRHIVRPYQMQPEFWLSRAYRNGRGTARMVLARHSTTGLLASARRAGVALLHGIIWAYFKLCPYAPSRNRARCLLHWMRGYRQEAATLYGSG